VLFNVDAFKREPILAVVGELQFDVVKARLENEYHVPTMLERISIDLARWVNGPEPDILKIADRSNVWVCVDFDQHYVALFKDDFYLNWTKKQSPSLIFETRN